MKHRILHKINAAKWSQRPGGLSCKGQLGSEEVLGNHGGGNDFLSRRWALYFMEMKGVRPVGHILATVQEWKSRVAVRMRCHWIKEKRVNKNWMFGPAQGLGGWWGHYHKHGRASAGREADREGRGRVLSGALIPRRTGLFGKWTKLQERPQVQGIDLGIIVLRGDGWADMTSWVYQREAGR